MNPYGRNLSDIVPRPVPLLVKLRVCLPGWAQLVWAVFGVTMGVFWLTGADKNIRDLLRLAWRNQTAPGVVSATEDTGQTAPKPKHSSRAGYEIYSVDFRFKTPDGAEHSGRSYSTGKPPEAGKPVTVEYAAGNPSNACIAGLRAMPEPHWVLLVLIFPTVPAQFIVWSLLRGRKGIRLLRDGEIAMGTYTGMEPTNATVNKRTVMKLKFEFRAGDGQTYTATMKTSQPERVLGPDEVHCYQRKAIEEAEAKIPPFLDKIGLGKNLLERAKAEIPEPSAGDGAQGPRQEPLLYDILDPNYAMLTHDLPGDPHIDEEGRIRVKNPMYAVLAAIIPLAVIGANLAMAFHRYGR